MKEHFVQQLVPARADSSLELQLAGRRLVHQRQREVLEVTLAESRKLASRLPASSSPRTVVLVPKRRLAFNFFPLQFCVHLNPRFLQ